MEPEGSLAHSQEPATCLYCYLNKAITWDRLISELSIETQVDDKNASRNMYVSIRYSSVAGTDVSL
jgi:hypothetical protein